MGCGNVKDVAEEETEAPKQESVFAATVLEHEMPKQEPPVASVVEVAPIAAVTVVEEAPPNTLEGKMTAFDESKLRPLFDKIECVLDTTAACCLQRRMVLPACCGCC